MAKTSPSEDDDIKLDELIERIQSTQIARGRRLIPIVRVSKTAGREKLPEGFIAEPEQMGKMAGYAKAHGCELMEARREMNVSGGKVDRKVLKQAVVDVIAGKADGIIVARVNRYARTTAGLQMVRKLQAAGKTFVAVDEGIGPEMLQTSFGWFTFTLMLAVAELQLAMLTEGFRMARKFHVEAGIANQVPYGYRKRDKEETDRPRRLELDPVTAPWVRYIFKRRAAGASWSAIARELDAKNVAPPGGGECWLFNRVRAIVANRTYLGELHSGADYVNPKAHKAIVTVELWQQANAKKSTPARGDRDPYLLTGLVRCASCGGRMTGYVQSHKAGRNRDGEVVRREYYRCRRNYTWGICTAQAYAPAAELDRLVVAEFMRRFVHVIEDTQLANDRSAELNAAQDAIDEATADYDLFVGSPATKRTVKSRGQEWYDDEVDKRNDAIEAAQAAWQEIRNAMSGLDLPADLAVRWDRLPGGIEDQRGFLSDAFGVVAVKPFLRRKGPVAERVHIWARNEPGSPEATLPGRDTGICAEVPIKF